jgi:hypothetical protein
MLKKMMIGAAFAAVISAPALAQSYDPAMGTGNVTAQPNYGPYAYRGYAPQPYGYGYEAYAYVPDPYVGAYSYVPAPSYYDGHRRYWR